MRPASFNRASVAGAVPWKTVAVVSLAGNLIFLILFGLPGGSGGAAEVDRAIDEYFRVWSSQNMEAYSDCFHPAAVVNFLDAKGVPRPSGLGPFVEGQRLAHANSRTQMREIPLRKETEADARVAHSVVRWKLFNDGGEETGTDYFTYIKTKNGWKIISLVFRKDAP